MHAQGLRAERRSETKTLGGLTNCVDFLLPSPTAQDPGTPGKDLVASLEISVGCPPLGSHVFSGWSHRLSSFPAWT